ncbi:hypothetical protein Cgig2_020223 [Carnegiea gigantea]|uniref:Uncharacterized protein n=1 Tax=Carnegiea gigantea TaxID=171969 RepID=A0A9Q1QR34_9CARY|nr:hypothetical protein Cgig2_020223 [Carnegiea gigantea]
MAPPKRNYLPLLLLSLITLFFILSHYFLSPPPSPSPSLSTPTHVSRNQTPQKFTFTVKVLGYDRLLSLSRCLRSLSAADYGGDTVNLHIFIDHFVPPPPSDVAPKLENSSKILDFVDGFRWDFGEKLVHYRTVNVGLQAQWLEAWWPSSDDEFVFVVEDDLEVSPLYYQFLKRLIENYYYNQSNFSPSIYGASLQRPRFVPGKHGNKMNLDSETRLFLYQLVGTWGQLLFPRPWKEFRRWYDDHKVRGLKPFLEGMVTNGWYKRMGERIWTPWFIKFIHSHGYFNIYTNFLHERALSVSHRDAGVNYKGSAGPDSQLLDRNSLDISRFEMQPLSKLRWYDFCFKEVVPGRVAKKLDEVGPILHSMGKQKPVLLVSLLKASERIVRNLICHFEKLDIQNYIFMVPGSKSDLLLDLARRGHPVIDMEGVFDSIIRRKTSSPDLIKDIMVKAYVVKKCLESGFDSWVVDWNILLLSNDFLLNSIDPKQEFYSGKGLGFFLARSSLSSCKIWGKFATNLESLVSEPSPSSEYGNFVDIVSKFSGRQGLKLTSLDGASFTLKLGSVGFNQTLPENTKMISWSPEAETDSVQNHLQELGIWIIDSDLSCKAVICRQS